MQPVWQPGKFHLSRATGFLPAIGLTGRVYRGWRNYAATVTAQVDAGFDIGSIAYLPARMGEVHMPSATPGNRLHRLGQLAVFALESVEAFFTAVSRIDIQDYES